MMVAPIDTGLAPYSNKDVRMGDKAGAGQLKLVTISAVILAGVSLGFAFFFMKAVMIPLVLAVFLSYLIRPLVHLLEHRLKIPRGLAILLALGLSGAMLGILSLLISSSVKSLGPRLSDYQENLVSMGDRILAYLQSKGIPVDREVVLAELAELPVGTLLSSVVDSLVSSLSNLFLVLIFVVYLLGGGSGKASKEGILLEIDKKIRNYVTVKVMLSLVTGLLVGIILKILGMELAVVFGLMAFLLNFIPSIGSVFATLLPLPLAIMQFDSGISIALVVLLPGTVQMVVGNVIEPKIMGTSLNLHPITVLLSLIFWGTLWGITGMILAAPITAVLKIVLERTETTKPLADLMAGHIG
jgi:AI-2 transport protein TqsA